MGLFDSLRRAVGGGDDGPDETEARPDLVDVTALGPDAFRDRAENAASDGDPLDFSVTSLERLDEAIAAKDDWTERRPSDGTAYSPKTVQFGSYLGEVLVRTYDGEWTADDGWGVTVTGREGDVTVAVFEVAARSVAGDPVFAAVAERLTAELDLVEQDGSVGVEPAPVDDETATGPADDQPDEDPGATAPEADGRVADTPADAPAEAADDARDEVVPDEVYPTMDAVEPEDGGDDEAATAVSDADETVADEVYPTMDAADPTAESETTDAAEAEQSDVDLLGSGATETDAGTAVDRSSRSDTTAAAEDGTASADAATDGDVETDTPTAADPTAGAGDSPSTTDERDPATEAAPTAGDGLRAEYAATAAEFTDFWTEHDLDFTPASLARLDDLVGAEWDDDRFEDATFGSEATFDDRAFTSVTTELGSYFGEVLVRALDGEWSTDTDHEAVVVVEGADGPLAVPVFQVAANSLRTVPVFARSYEALLADLGRDT